MFITCQQEVSGAVWLGTPAFSFFSEMGLVWCCHFLLSVTCCCLSLVLQADEAEFDHRSRRSSVARTARASEWGHTAIFSDEVDEDGKTLAGRSSRGGRSLAGGSAVGGGRGGGGRQQQQRGGSRVQLGPDSADPQDLLEPSTARQMVKLAAGTAGAGAARADGEPEFPRGDDGRCVCRNFPPALLQARGLPSAFALSSRLPALLGSYFCLSTTVSVSLSSHASSC